MFSTTLHSTGVSSIMLTAPNPAFAQHQQPTPTRPLSAIFTVVKTNGTRTARRATAPSMTRRSCNQDHHPIMQSYTTLTNQNPRVAGTTTVRRPRRRFIFTSDALPVDAHGCEAADVDTEVEPAYRSDAFGDGYRPPDLVFSHLPGPKGWYHICNAPLAGAELAITVKKDRKVAVKEVEDPNTEVGGDVDVLAKLKGLLGILKKGQSRIGKVGDEEECDDGSCADEDEGCSESWNKRDARRYGLVGGFELENERSR